MQWILIKVATFQNNKRKTGFHMKQDYFPCMVKFSKEDPGPVPHLRWSSLQQLASPDGLTTSSLLKFAEHLSCQAHPDTRFYKKKLFTQSDVNCVFTSIDVILVSIFVNLGHFTPFSNIFIFNFEQVNIDWQ